MYVSYVDVQIRIAAPLPLESNSPHKSWLLVSVIFTRRPSFYFDSFSAGFFLSARHDQQKVDPSAELPRETCVGVGSRRRTGYIRNWIISVIAATHFDDD